MEDFFFFWLLWVFIAVCRLSLIAASKGHSSLCFKGCSLWLLPWSMGFIASWHLRYFQAQSAAETTCSAGDEGNMGSIPGLRRSPAGGHGNPLQYSCLENSMDRGAWQAIVHRIAKNRTWLNNRANKQMRSLTWWWVYIAGLEIPDLSVAVCLRLWVLWSVCGCACQGAMSLYSFWLYFLYVR